MKKTKGFTLIELLVVISIIGLLSSVVLASLNGARNKAKISAFEAELVQFRTVMDLEYSTLGNYGALAPGTWASTMVDAYAASCATTWSPNSADPYVVQANSLCNNIVALSGDQYALYVQRGYPDPSQFSIQGYLVAPTELIYCIGTGGITFGQPYSTTVYSDTGCSNNP